MRTPISADAVRVVAILLALSFLLPPAFAQDPPAATPASPAAAADSSTPSAPSAATLESEPAPAATAPAATAAVPAPTEPASAIGLFDRINAALAPVDAWFGSLNAVVGKWIFYPIPIETPNPENTHQTAPFAVILLVLGAAFFTIRMGFISIRAFSHAISITAGRYESSNDTGDVSHFQALTTALSATVGLGNIAGVTTAIALGGPGAAFWMVLAGFLGMSSKFVECTLGQKYREVRPDGRVMGGAMFYLSRGLAELGLAPLGKVFAVAFAVLCVGGSFAGGNAYQVKGSLDAVGQTLPIVKEYPWIYGLLMLVLTAIVIVGGIRRIASTADKIVPVMCSVYVLAGIVILFKNASAVPAAFSTILSMAFTPDAARGGFFGVLVWGFKRAAFSNEAGVGSAAIAHAAAKTEYPIREGIVALLEPFVDTIIVCTMTALVIVVTGAYDYQNPDFAPEYRALYDFNEQNVATGVKGAALTSVAMDGQIPGFRYVLACATFLFAYSTMISWSYYGERCWAWLFGEKASNIYKAIFLLFTFLGSVISAGNVMDFGDLMIFGMMIPNMLGLFLLSGGVARDLNVYWSKLKSGQLDREHQEKVKATKA